MIPLLPDLPSLPTSPASGPSFAAAALPGIGPVGPEAEAGGIDFAGLLDAALPLPAHVPGMKAGALAVLPAGPALPDDANPRPDDAPPTGSSPAPKPQLGEGPPRAALRLPTGSNLPFAGALLPGGAASSPPPPVSPAATSPGAGTPPPTLAPEPVAMPLPPGGKRLLADAPETSGFDAALLPGPGVAPTAVRTVPRLRAVPPAALPASAKLAASPSAAVPEDAAQVPVEASPVPSREPGDDALPVDLSSSPAATVALPGPIEAAPDVEVDVPEPGPARPAAQEASQVAVPVMTFASPAPPPLVEPPAAVPATGTDVTALLAARGTAAVAKGPIFASAATLAAGGTAAVAKGPITAPAATLAEGGTAAVAKGPITAPATTLAEGGTVAVAKDPITAPAATLAAAVTATTTEELAAASPAAPLPAAARSVPSPSSPSAAPSPRRAGVSVPLPPGAAPDAASLAALAAALPEVAPDQGSPPSASAPAAPALAPAPVPALAAAGTPLPVPPAAPAERPDPQGGAPAAGPQLQSTIDLVGDLREALRSARPAMVLDHAEFGAVSVRLENGGGEGWRAVLASRDPGFVPAIQQALAERAVAAAAASPDSGASPGQGGAFHNGTGDQRSGSSLSGGQGGSQPYLGQSGARDGEAAPDHRRPSTAAALAARAEAADGGSTPGQAAPTGGLFA